MTAVVDAARRHRTSGLVLFGLLVVVAAANAFGMFRNPQAIDDEGTYVAQAWAVVRDGDLAHYTYWYDHPPLGWLQLAGYAFLTGGFDRAANAIDVGREFMLLTQLVSSSLLWVLCRRLGLARSTSAVAVLIFGLSPLAVQFHRTVFLDNIATPWVLAAFALAASPKGRMAELGGAAFCFAVAVLTKETSLLLLPGVAMLVWRSSEEGTRRYNVAVTSALLVAIGSAYGLFALIKGELLPSVGQVSLLEGIEFQLVGRASGGSVFDASTANRATVDVWRNLDPITPVLALLFLPLGLAVRRLRPVAVVLAVLVAMLLRPGYLPVPLIIAMLPLAAVVIAGVLDEALVVRRLHESVRLPASARLSTSRVVGGVAAIALLVATPAWGLKLRGLWRSAPNDPVVAAEEWIVDNVARGERLMIDDVFWVDLVEAGFDRDDVVWTYKVDTDPAVMALAPDGWRDYDWVVVTSSMRRDPTLGARVDDAIANSVTVASFGEDEDLRVDVRRIVGPDTPAVADAELRRLGGQALLSNDAVSVDEAPAEALRSGTVDERLLTILAGASQNWRFRIDDIPVVEGEADNGLPRRTVLLESLEPNADLVALERFVADQPALGVTATTTPSGIALTTRPRVDPTLLLEEDPS